jgi:hypothetical protein
MNLQGYHTGKRNDNVHTNTYTAHRTRQYEWIGPPPGTTANLINTNAEKASNGITIETGFIPSINPRLCVSAWLGVLLLYRARCMADPIPNVTSDNKALYHYKCVYRSTGSALKPMDPTTINTIWSDLYASAGIIVERLGHQWRRQAQIELSEKGIPGEQISQLTGYAVSERWLLFVCSVQPV